MRKKPWAWIGIGRKSALLICIWALLSVAVMATADDAPSRSQGQTVYVPIYSHIYAGDREKNPVYLAATLSIRNTDPQQSITVVKADYNDSNGHLIKNYIQSPVTLIALSSTHFVIKESDKTGGPGAHFIVQWTAAQPTNPALVESVMISTRSAQGISFTSRGQVIEP
ncbi:MAG: DUF3124 domain-containing protein [Desulfobacteraceae bacterium]|nr:DUF3124 domain-containing protein [Desulfobacteraceae bacterium]